MRSVDTRKALRAGWGLCGRHAWALAVVECELAPHHHPYSSALLCRELIHAAGRLVIRGRDRGLGARLAGQGVCPTCDSIARQRETPPDGDDLLELRRASAGWRDRQVQANDGQTFRRLLLDLIGGPGAGMAIVTGSTDPRGFGAEFARSAQGGQGRGGVSRVQFWPELDYIGVDAYPPIPGDVGQGWSTYMAHVIAQAHAWARPLILTGVSEPAAQGAHLHPSAWIRWIRSTSRIRPPTTRRSAQPRSP